MPDRLRAALAAGVHALIVLGVTVAATRGLHIPDDVAGYIDATAVAGGVAAWTFAIHWLATRTGDSLWARAERKAAQILTLGAGALATAASVPPSIHVVVNARPKIVRSATVSYDEVVFLAGGPHDAMMTITYRGADRPTQGSLLPGRTVTVRTGTIFNATATSRG